MPSPSLSTVYCFLPQGRLTAEKALLCSSTSSLGYGWKENLEAWKVLGLRIGLYFLKNQKNKKNKMRKTFSGWVVLVSAARLRLFHPTVERTRALATNCRFQIIYSPPQKQKKEVWSFHGAEPNVKPQSAQEKNWAQNIQLWISGPISDHKATSIEVQTNVISQGHLWPIPQPSTSSPL